jgi:hypothetical protein
MIAWRATPQGVMVPVQWRSGQADPRQVTWPRPAGWDQLPADIRAAWDARWARVQAR